MKDVLAIKRFLKYSSVGGVTFLGDLGLLFVLTDYIGVQYVIASGAAFLLAVSVNYFLSRRFVFKGTERGVESGYANFISIALVGVCLVMGGMYLLVEWLGVGYVLARVLVAGVTGLWNYLMNLFVNFKVAGLHLE